MVEFLRLVSIGKSHTNIGTLNPKDEINSISSPFSSLLPLIPLQFAYLGVGYHNTAHGFSSAKCLLVRF